MLNHIREIRETKGLSQAMLAAYTGVSRSTINKIERGTRNPSTTLLKRIAQMLNVTADDLLHE